jgi:hypothetical protein
VTARNQPIVTGDDPDRITAELARDAVELSWTRDGARDHESRGITPAAVATRR